MRQIRRNYVLIAASANAICASQTPAGAGNLTINGGKAVSVPTFNWSTNTYAMQNQAVITAQQFVTVTSGGSDESGKTFTITGYDSNNMLVTEVLTGPTASATVTSVQCYQTVSSIAVSAATTGAVTAGFAGSGIQPWIPVDRNTEHTDIVATSHVGTLTYQVEVTADNVQDNTGIFKPGYVAGTYGPVVDATPVASTVSTNSTATITGRIAAIRMNVTAYTSGNCIFTVMQSGY